MPFLIRLTIPKSKCEEEESAPQGVDNAIPVITMEEGVRSVLSEHNVKADVWSSTQDGNIWIVEFQILDLQVSEQLLDRLAYYNVGKTADSTIMVIEPIAVINRKDQPVSEEKNNNIMSEQALKKFVHSLKSRLTVAQVYHAMVQKGKFDVNYLVFLLCAAVVADIALVTNSAAVVFASMLLSPLMDPIMCTLFGLSLKDSKLIRKGLRNGLISLLICLIVGFTVGAMTHYVSVYVELTMPYPTSEMVNRGYARGLLSSALVACFSGISVAFATLHNSLAALIGNAISLSLLPPAVNCGHFILLSVLAFSDRTMPGDNSTGSMRPGQICEYSFVRNYTPRYFNDACQMPSEFLALGGVSFGLTVLNIIIVIITGMFVNWIKDFAPQEFMNDQVKKHFKIQEKINTESAGHCFHRDDAHTFFQKHLREFFQLKNVDLDANPEACLQTAKEFDSLLHGLTLNQDVQSVGDKKLLGDLLRVSDAVVNRRGSLALGQKSHNTITGNYRRSMLDNGSTTPVTFDKDRVHATITASDFLSRPSMKQAMRANKESPYVSLNEVTIGGSRLKHFNLRDIHFGASGDKEHMQKFQRIGMGEDSSSSSSNESEEQCSADDLDLYNQQRKARFSIINLVKKPRSTSLFSGSPQTSTADGKKKKKNSRFGGRNETPLSVLSEADDVESGGATGSPEPMPNRISSVGGQGTSEEFLLKNPSDQPGVRFFVFDGATTNANPDQHVDTALVSPIEPKFTKPLHKNPSSSKFSVMSVDSTDAPTATTSSIIKRKHSEPCFSSLSAEES